MGAAGWQGGSRTGAYVLYLQVTHVVVWKKPTQHYKTIILQFKKKNYKVQSMAFVPAETLEFISTSQGHLALRLVPNYPFYCTLVLPHPILWLTVIPGNSTVKPTKMSSRERSIY